MRTFATIFKEQISSLKTVVFAYGRFNPPTIGHEKLINKVKSVAQGYQCDYFIIPSDSVKPPDKNPLDFELKIEMLSNIVGLEHLKEYGKTYITVLTNLMQEGYGRIVQVAGSDRREEFLSLLKKYNGVTNKRTNEVDFFFEDFIVVSSGERDPDSTEGVEGVSGTLARQLAKEGNFNGFEKIIPLSVPHNLKLQAFKKISESV